MEPDKKRIHEFMLADGSVSSCFISPEESARIAMLEGVSLPYIHSSMHQSLDSKVGEKPQNVSQETSSSYIIIKCDDEAIPRLNRLQLRTEPPTYIELQPGENILSVDDYPELRYGFRQIEDFVIKEEDKIAGIYEYNCDDVYGIDLSHFDSSEVTSMNNMFERMAYLGHLNFGSTTFNNITSIDHAFNWINVGSEIIDSDILPSGILDLSGIDFSKIQDTTEMLYGCNFDTVNLSGCDMSTVEYANNMFNNCGIRKLILDDAKLSNAVIEAITTEVRDWSNLEEVSLKGCESETIKCIISGLTFDRPETWGPLKFITDPDVHHQIVNDENGESSIRVVKTHTTPESYYVVNGTILQRWNDRTQAIACVPHGITAIAEKTFADAVNLKYILLPETVTHIDHLAFEGCVNLEHINLHENIESIGESIFEGCRNLKHLYLSNNILSFGSLGKVELDFLRIPYKLWTCWISHSTEVKSMVIGLPKTPFDFDLRPLIEFSNKTPAISLEPFESYSNGCDIYGVKVIDGLIMGITESDDEYLFEDVLGVFSIPETTLALPYGLGKICDCLSPARYLYIPDTVFEIDEDAFTYPSQTVLITKKSNLTHLIEILPTSLVEAGISLYII